MGETKFQLAVVCSQSSFLSNVRLFFLSLCQCVVSNQYHYQLLHEPFLQSLFSFFIGFSVGSIWILAYNCPKRFPLIGRKWFSASRNASKWTWYKRNKISGAIACPSFVPPHTLYLILPLHQDNSGNVIANPVSRLLEHSINRWTNPLQLGLLF